MNTLAAFITGCLLIASPSKAALRYGSDTETSFAYYDYDGTRNALKDMAEKYPHLVKVEDAQTKWDVASPGQCGSSGCRQYFAHFTNHATLAQDTTRPEVFFSGSVHGNERVGPTATIEFMLLLIENYESGANPWLRRLLDTRSIFIMPNANALGYHDNVRTENGLDPNRDFPYGRTPQTCMQTTAARALNEIYREHVFQLAFTFHGGMRCIAYEWGSPNHYGRGNDGSPDEQALKPLSLALQGFSSGSNYYPVGRMNSIVYAVTGGMEDWAYAASWDLGYTQPCQPSEFNGYPKEKTVYTSDMLRTFNILVETADQKAPYASTLGGSHNVLQGIGAGTGHEGHISRNLRLCVAMADLVQPYVVWAGATAEDPATAYHPTPSNAANSVSWDVGGALMVDETALFIIEADEADDADGGCPAVLSASTLTKLRADAGGATGVPLTDPQHSTIHPGSSTLSSETYGGTIWTKMFAQVPANPSVLDASWSPYKGRYGQAHTFATSPAGKRWYMVAGAKVDQNWAGTNTEGRPSGMAPQSHVVKARTIEGYTATVGESTLEGHLWWFSAPRCYMVTDADGDITTTARPGNAGNPTTSSSSNGGGDSGDTSEPKTNSSSTTSTATATSTKATTSTSTSTSTTATAASVPPTTSFTTTTTKLFTTASTTAASTEPPIAGCANGALFNYDEPIRNKKRPDNDTDHVIAMVNATNAEACAVLCNNAGEVCASFWYRGKTEVCMLFPSDGGLANIDDDTAGKGRYYLRGGSCREETTVATTTTGAVINAKSSSSSTSTLVEPVATTTTRVTTSTTAASTRKSTPNKLTAKPTPAGGPGAGKNNGDGGAAKPSSSDDYTDDDALESSGLGSKAHARNVTITAVVLISGAVVGLVLYRRRARAARYGMLNNGNGANTFNDSYAGGGRKMNASSFGLDEDDSDGEEVLHFRSSSNW